MIRVFVGCAPNHEDAESQAVLEHSIRRYCSEAVDITWMKLSTDVTSPFYGWNTEQWATPFSGLRWAIPFLCGYKGRAIYMDSDVIVMADLTELWHTPMPKGCAIMAKSHNRLCVSLWDCGAIQLPILPFHALRSDPSSHSIMRKRLAAAKAIVHPFPAGANWNCLDGEDEPCLIAPHIKAIHYTAMRHQPHLPHAIGRLSKIGRQHWFDGDVAPHWRTDLMFLFYQLLGEASPVSDYCKDPIYGDYKKQSVAGVGKPKWSTLAPTNNGESQHV